MLSTHTRTVFHFVSSACANLLVQSVQTTTECTPGEFVECTVLKCARVVYKVGIKSLHTPVQTPRSLKLSPPPSNVTFNPSDSIWGGGGNDDIGMNVTRSASCFQTLCCHLCLTQKPEISTTSMEALRCVHASTRAYARAGAKWSKLRVCIPSGQCGDGAQRKQSTLAPPTTKGKQSPRPSTVADDETMSCQF